MESRVALLVPLVPGVQCLCLLSYTQTLDGAPQPYAPVKALSNVVPERWVFHTGKFNSSSSCLLRLMWNFLFKACNVCAL